MGGGHSQDELLTADSRGFGQSNCPLPDLGIDESLVKYSGFNSNAELQSYSNGLVNSVPGFVEKLGSVLGPVTTIPNAVGLGALVISMIMEIAIKTTQTSPDTYSLLRRVFGEEKASGVRDTMSEYLRRHRMFITNDQKLLEEIQRLEQQLSNQLTILRNSLLHDGQMSPRGFTIWVNGVSFHLQMLIHQARLNTQAGKCLSDCAHQIKVAIDDFAQDLGPLLEKRLFLRGCIYIYCLRNAAGQCVYRALGQDWHHHVTEYEEFLTLKKNILDTKNDIDSLIKQNDTFTLPSR